MKILFMHPNMPGQYKHLVRVFAEDPENKVIFLTKPKEKVTIPNVVKIEYEVLRDAAVECHRYLIPFERAVHHSQEIWRICKKMKADGFVPDVIVGHLGWGDGMFLKDIFQYTPVLSLFEFFYSPYGGDVGFLQGDEPHTADECARIRMKNALHLFNLTYSDWGICPTFFQRDQHPKEFFSKISVIHDGVDTNHVKPGTGKNLVLGEKLTFKPTDEVITYISRNFEPYRGFTQFMHAAEIILKNHPNAHILMVGQDGVSYGKKAPGGKTWRQIMMEKVKLDPARFHVLGYLPYDDMLKVLQISSAHIYLTVPFVLSWSMMEAMASQCLVIGSDTDPVREAITHEENGLLVDFFSADEIAKAVGRVLNHPDRMQELRKNARQTVLDRYSLQKLLPMHINLVKDLASGNCPPPTAERILEMHQKFPVNYKKAA